MGTGHGPAPPADPTPEGAVTLPSSSERVVLGSLVREPDFDHEGKEIIFFKTEKIQGS